MWRLTRRLILLAVFIQIPRIAHAEDATTIGPALPDRPFFVEDFRVVDQDSATGLVLSRLRSALHSNKAHANAVTLVHAIVRELNAAGLSVNYVSKDDVMPRSGWLISGTFYAGTEKRQFSWPFSDTGHQAPNTEVTVALSDLAINPHVPFAVIGKADTLRGQGSIASWNPYIVIAKLIINSSESKSSIDALAKEIVADIVSNRGLLEQQDATSHPTNQPR